MNSQFVKQSLSVWKLDPRIKGERRKRLKTIGFEDIVHRFQRNLRVLVIKRQKKKNCSAVYRVVVTISCRSQDVDLFHNGAAGYRAQYLASVKRGRIANRYLIDSLTERIKRFLKSNPKRGCPPNFLTQSLSSRTAKCWIHQGRWIRLNKQIDRNLAVPKWKKPRDAREHKLLKWAALTPDDEAKVVIKGGWVDFLGKKKVGSSKPNRDLEIKSFGFT